MILLHRAQTSLFTKYVERGVAESLGKHQRNYLHKLFANKARKGLTKKGGRGGGGGGVGAKWST